MWAILNSLNAHNFHIFQPILLNWYQNPWFIELFLIKLLNIRVAVPFECRYQCSGPGSRYQTSEAYFVGTNFLYLISMYRAEILTTYKYW